MVRKFPITTPCWPWVGSTAVTNPRPICWAITAPATCNAERVTRAVAPSTMPMMISWTISTTSGVSDCMSTW